MSDNAKIVSRLKSKLEKYENERGFDDYTEETVLQDLVFFVGQSVSPKDYNYAQGFRAFLNRLKELNPCEKHIGL